MDYCPLGDGYIRQKTEERMNKVLTDPVLGSHARAHLPNRLVRFAARAAQSDTRVVPPCSIQPQSANLASRIQTGLPIAPARWAMQVSVVMTRSSVATKAAVSARSRSRLEPPQTKTSPGRQGSCSDASPFCNEIQVMPGARSKGRSVFKFMDRCRSAL